MKQSHVKSEKIMSLNHFHDFYYLEALRASIANEISKKPELQFSRSVEKLKDDVQETIETIVPNLALRTFVYLYAACLGEARHARETLSSTLFIPEVNGLHRVDVYSNIFKYKPNQENLRILVKIFEQDWRGGYGGKAWKNIAEALTFYGKVPDEAFIDHVIDLEHNGGCVFSKDETKTTILFDVRYGGNFKQFLDYKFRYDILKRSFYDYLFYDYLSVTPKVFRIIHRYSVIFGQKVPSWLRADLTPLDDYTVLWGNEKLSLEVKWHDWVDVTSKNSPTADTLLALAEIGEVYPKYHTALELQKFAKKAKTKSKKIAGKYMTKELLKELDKKLADWLQWSLKQCKIEKAKVLYSVVPCKIAPSGNGYDITVFVPHESIGKPCSDGFTFKTKSKMGIFLSEPSDGHFSYEYGELCLFTNNKKYMFHYKPLEAILYT